MEVEVSRLLSASREVEGRSYSLHFDFFVKQKGGDQALLPGDFREAFGQILLLSPAAGNFNPKYLVMATGSY